MYRLSPSDHVCLTQHLLSANSKLRKAVLQMLSAFSTESTTSYKIWNACLAIEASDMTLQNVRERTANIGKLGRLLEAIPASDENQLVEDATRYLISQLKVNFRPLYPDTIAALAGLGSSRGETLWSLVWDQLQSTIASETAVAVDLDWAEPEWTKVAPVQSGDSDEGDEEDKEFICPNLFKGRRALSSAWASSADPASADLSEEIQVS
jgi:U3 small nucleolar RNA-associated protein 20